jgi:hypothetical protein
MLMYTTAASARTALRCKSVLTSAERLAAEGLVSDGRSLWKRDLRRRVEEEVLIMDAESEADLLLVLDRGDMVRDIMWRGLCRMRF